MGMTTGLMILKERGRIEPALAWITGGTKGSTSLAPARDAEAEVHRSALWD
jgi:hypothetical protein